MLPKKEISPLRRKDTKLHQVGEYSMLSPTPLSLALEVIADPDSMDDQQLVLFVVLQLTPAEAFAKLQRFDNEWWLDAMDEAQGHLCISLEFR
jgi:hypothetical protein